MTTSGFTMDLTWTGPPLVTWLPSAPRSHWGQLLPLITVLKTQTSFLKGKFNFSFLFKGQSPQKCLFFTHWVSWNLRKRKHNKSNIIRLKSITLFPVYTHTLVAGQASKVKQDHLTWSNQDNKYRSIKQNTGHVSVCSKSSLIFDNILSWWQSEQHREDGGWKKTQQLYWCNFQ